MGSNWRNVHCVCDVVIYFVYMVGINICPNDKDQRAYFGMVYWSTIPIKITVRGRRIYCHVHAYNMSPWAYEVTHRTEYSLVKIFESPQI